MDLIIAAFIAEEMCVCDYVWLQLTTRLVPNRRSPAICGGEHDLKMCRFLFVVYNRVYKKRLGVDFVFRNATVDLLLLFPSLPLSLPSFLSLRIKKGQWGRVGWRRREKGL